MQSGKCPFKGSMANSEQSENKSTHNFWPNRLNLTILNKPDASSNPMGKDFNYANEVDKTNFESLIKDLIELMTTSQTFWPADYGHYGPLFIRLAWHSAGTYRVADGRGGAGYGMQRFAPLNSWPDNINLDKARRLLWPIKKKYGKQISWADLMILAGNVALESMGMKTFGFGAGREDSFEPDTTYWGPENTWLADKRHDVNHNLENPLAATQMGLIYVNPEGPMKNPDILGSAKDIKETFGRMAMDLEETVALIAGGHTFGKAHGAAEAMKYVGKEPESAPIDAMGLGWINTFGKGNAQDTISSGLEGAWTSTPTKWDDSYLKTLFKYEWKQTKSPAGATQWIPANELEAERVQDAHDPSKTHLPIMFTTDLALRYDPEFEQISRRFLNDFPALEKAFAKAWYKLTHRDMGPNCRLKGPLVPKEILLWQDPIEVASYQEISQEHLNEANQVLKNLNFSIKEMISTAWASASTFRKTDKRGGANGARIRLLPQKEWQVNNPKELAYILDKIETAQQILKKKNIVITIADLIVIAGNLGIELAASNAGYKIKVPFKGGRGDALQEHTDILSINHLEPVADGFRGYMKQDLKLYEEDLLIEKAYMLDLSIPEMSVLYGGMRVLNITKDPSTDCLVTNKKDSLTNDFFVNLLEPNLTWKTNTSKTQRYDAFDCNKKHKWTFNRLDLLFASNSQIRAVTEVYGSNDAKEKFVHDFVKAWNKVMMLDRFDLEKI
jgi:catalase-peroxidase